MIPLRAPNRHHLSVFRSWLDEIQRASSQFETTSHGLKFLEAQLETQQTSRAHGTVA